MVTLTDNVARVSSEDLSDVPTPNLFNAITKHIQRIRLQPEEPDPFHIFLTDGGGVGKSFILNTQF